MLLDAIKQVALAYRAFPKPTFLNAHWETKRPEGTRGGFQVFTFSDDLLARPDDCARIGLAEIEGLGVDPVDVYQLDMYQLIQPDPETGEAVALNKLRVLFVPRNGWVPMSERP